MTTLYLLLAFNLGVLFGAGWAGRHREPADRLAEDSKHAVVRRMTLMKQ